jgi:hypothetical protein
MPAHIKSCTRYYSFDADTSSCEPSPGCASPSECSSPPDCCCGASVSDDYIISWPNFCPDFYKIYCTYAQADNYGSIGGVDLTPERQPPPACYDLSYIRERTEINDFTYDAEAEEIKIPYSVRNDDTSCGPWGGYFYIEIVSCQS